MQVTHCDQHSSLPHYGNNLQPWNFFTVQATGKSITVVKIFTVPSLVLVLFQSCQIIVCFFVFSKFLGFCGATTFSLSTLRKMTICLTTFQRVKCVLLSVTVCWCVLLGVTIAANMLNLATISVVKLCVNVLNVVAPFFVLVVRK